MKDIVDLCTKRDRARRETVVVRAANFALPANISELVNRYPSLTRIQDANGNWQYYGLHPTLGAQHSIGGGQWPDRFDAHLITDQSAEAKAEWFAEQFGSGLIAFLTTEHRLQLVKEANSSEYDYATENLLQAFYNAGSGKECEVADCVSKVFAEKRIALDFTNPRKLRIRVAADFSDVPTDPRDARSLMAKKRQLDLQGDGIRSFVGMVVALKTLDRPLILIDEPEAFLHPPQAYEMGRLIGNEAKAGRQIIVATHSTDVLRGITAVMTSARIVRIDRKADTNTFRQLEQETLRSVSADPLLSSSRVLEGLFYPAAVITEGDRDNRFFESVFHKLDGSIDLYLVNASSKQTVPKIMSVYSNMGIRRVGIVDFDILRVEDDWLHALDDLQFSSAERMKAVTLRNEIAAFVKQQPANQRIEATVAKLTEISAAINGHRQTQLTNGHDAEHGAEVFLKTLERRLQEAANLTKPWNELKKRGRELLSPDLKSQFDDLFALCASHGLFIIPTGEIESMLADYGVEHTTDKRDWIGRALKLVPSLEVEPNKHPWNLGQAIIERLKA